MARFAGRNGRVYFAVASGGEASALPFIATWSMNAASERFEVTAFGDGSKTYVAGLPDGSGEFGGFMDDATAQTYTAAVDGVARKFYLYPTTPATTGPYWFGTVFADFSANGSVGGATELSSSWSAATPIAKVG